ncbi:MAG TPA: alpha-ribazole phosphatase [Methylophilaceae bacterium]|nr:alpha-ribazole phosphatase [Methylophilaceae bacterium]
MELYLIRHTAPDINAGICYGRSDIDVAATFEAEADVVLRKLVDAKPALVYTSPSQRCRKLADVLAQRHQCRSIEDVRLMELHFGEWEMLAWQEINVEALDRWGSSYIHQGPPGGEAYQALHQRAQDFLEEVRASDVESAAVVTHAGVIRALLAEVENKPLNDTFDYELGYGGVTHIRCSNQLQLVSLNI